MSGSRPACEEGQSSADAADRFSKRRRLEAAGSPPAPCRATASSGYIDAGRVPSVPASGAIQRLELAQAACEQLEHGRRQKHGLELQQQGDAALRAALAHGSPPPPSWKPAAAQATAAAAGPAPPATPDKQTVNDVASPVAPAEALEQGPVMLGLTVDVPRLAALLRRQAAASGASMAQLWQQAQAAVLRQSLRVLLACLERTEAAPTAEARLTAGVSYVVHSESTQQGARGMAQLPHLVYQPPGLKEVDSRLAGALADVLCSSATAAAVLPLREENAMKQYLLLPTQRRQLLQQHGGRLADTPVAAAGLESLLADRCFVCLHFRLDGAGQLHPVDGGAAAAGGAGSGVQRGVEGSNVQLGIMLRKGVGGTCPLRAAARRLAGVGVLGALLDGAPPTATARVAQPTAAVMQQQPAAASQAQDAAQPAMQPATPLPSPAAHEAPRSGSDAVSKSLAAVFVGALVGAAEADEAAAAADHNSGQAGGGGGRPHSQREQPHVLGTPKKDASQHGSQSLASVRRTEPPSASPASPPAARSQASVQSTAATPAPAAPPAPVSTAELEAALQRAAADLQAAETAAAAAEAAGDEEMPDFEAEEAAAEAAGATDGGAAGDEPPRGVGAEASGLSGAATAGLAGEEGVDELLREMREEEEEEEAQRLRRACEARQERPTPEARPQQEQAPPTPPAPTACPEAEASQRSAAEQPFVAPGSRAAPPPPPSQVHQRLSMHTLSGRLELYVEQGTWGALEGPSRDALFTAVRRVERVLLRELAAANRRRLLHFCRALQGLVGCDGSCGPVASLLLNSRLDGGHEESATLDHSGAVVLAASCLLAADSLAGGRGTGLQVPWPYYLIATRDSFTHHLVPLQTSVTSGGRRYLRTDFFLRAGECPDGYHAALAAASSSDSSSAGDAQAAAQGVLGAQVSGSEARQQQMEGAAAAQATEADDGLAGAVPHPEGLLPIGVTTVCSLFSEDELAAIEKEADGVDERCRRGLLPDSCFHRSAARGGSLKRTKYFFGARYLWTREQLGEADARVAGGVRVDVPPAPAWVRQQVEAPLVGAGLAAPGFVDSVALNAYHDGSEGIQSHFDDADRFSQPILSLRLFSDSRLSFGTQLYGYTNGAFCIPLPRGCVMVMRAGGYAANGVKHCVRPADMSGKSAGLILRQINPAARQEAQQLHMEETCAWLRCLSLNASTRAAQLLAQRSSGPSGAQAAASRPHRVPAAERREVWRLLRDMVRRVEAQERRERLEDVTAQLMLLSALRKVEAAERLGLDLCGGAEAEGGGGGGTNASGAYLGSPAAAVVFSLLDDVVSWVERPHASLAPAWQPATPCRTKRRAPLSQAQEVGRLLQRMVRGVEAAEAAEATTAAQVMHSAVCCVTAVAAWEEGGRQGPQPSYGLLPLSLPTGRPPAAAGQAASMPRVLMLASQVASLLFVGRAAALACAPPHAGAITAADVEAARAAVLQHTKLPSEAALRQALLLAATPVAAAAAADAVAKAAGSQPGSVQPAVLAQLQARAQQQAIVASLASILLQSQSQSQSQSQWQVPAAQQAPAGDKQQDARSAAVYAAALQAAAPNQPAGCRLAGMSDPRAGSQGSRTACGRTAAASDRAGAGLQRSGQGRSLGACKAPSAVCFACCRGVDETEAGGELWSCAGPCRRTFHHACCSPSNAAPDASPRCQECALSSHPCFACRGAAAPAGTLKCSVGQCGRFYHQHCLAASQTAKVSSAGRSAKRVCPLHFCARCGASGDGIPMVQCLLCPTGWHVRCRPPNARPVSKKYVVCADHITAQQAGRPEEQRQVVRQHSVQGSQPCLPSCTAPESAVGSVSLEEPDAPPALVVVQQQVQASAAILCPAQPEGSEAEVLDSEEGELPLQEASKKRFQQAPQAPLGARPTEQLAAMTGGVTRAASCPDKPAQTLLAAGELQAEASAATKVGCLAPHSGAAAAELSKAGSKSPHEQRSGSAASCASQAVTPQPAMSAGGSGTSSTVTVLQLQPSAAPVGAAGATQREHQQQRLLLDAAGSLLGPVLAQAHHASPLGQELDLDEMHGGEYQQQPHSASKGSSGLTLQPSWQTSAARRATLDYGDL